VVRRNVGRAGVGRGARRVVLHLDVHGTARASGLADPPCFQFRLLLLQARRDHQALGCSSRGAAYITVKTVSQITKRKQMRAR
jgi:hypothetical protein